MLFKCGPRLSVLSRHITLQKNPCSNVVNKFLKTKVHPPCLAVPFIEQVQSAKKSRGVDVRERRSLREALFELGGMHVLLYKLATLAPMESEQVSQV